MLASELEELPTGVDVVAPGMFHASSCRDLRV